MLEKKRGVKPLKSSLKVKLISGCYVGYSLIDMLISGISGFSIFYIFFLGLLCLIAAIGLWLQRSWGLWLATALSSLTFFIGAITLYAWIRFVGFYTGLHYLMLTAGLLFYSMMAAMLVFYLLANRRLFT